MQSVTVRVPATSANIGPGFDSLGIAFNLYNTFTFSLSDKTQVFGCEEKYSDENNLALVAFRAACQKAGKGAPSVALTVSASVPTSRGLGSSATLLVGGAVGANVLLNLGLSDAEIFEVVNLLEGHPDNVAPALFGGFTASLQEDGVPFTLKLSIHEKFRFCAFIPDFETSTHEARAVLPTTVPRADAVHNGSHVAVLIPAFAEGNEKLVGLALNDKLHEPYRKKLIDGFDEVKKIACENGAVTFFLSGSGSTLMAIYLDEDFPAKVSPEVEKLPHHWRVLPLEVDTEGAKIIE